MTRILVVNAGSSSLKLAVLDGDDLEHERSVERWDGTDLAPLGELREAAGAIDAVGHRVVHGGAHHQPALLDDELVRQLDDLTPLAPLHQPRSLAGIRAARRVLRDVPHVACFDTAFHATIPPAAHTYALPASWRERWPLRRFGFHGLSHQYSTARVGELTGLDPATLRIVVAHLGAGASLCAVVGGVSVDTTMGFTPLEGLVMQTRSGSIDPGLVLWLIEEGGLAPAEVEQGLEHESGLAGLARGSGDVRDVLARRSEGDADAALALDVYGHRLAQSTAAMVASAGGIDALVFTGGVGEHAAPVRSDALTRLAWLDPALADTAPADPALGASAGGDAELTSPGGRIRVFVIRAREDLAIARGVRSLLDC